MWMSNHQQSKCSFSVLQFFIKITIYKLKTYGKKGYNQYINIALYL